MRLVKGDAVIASVEQWFDAAPPKGGREQWRAGRSARECAVAWCGEGSPAVPSEIAALLASHPDTAGAAIDWATPEHRVRFDRLRGEPRNADLVAVAQHPHGLLALSVEAKADEPFDQPVRAVLDAAVAKIATDQRTNAVTRVQQLAAALLQPPHEGVAPLGALRYQLLTATAGALAFAAEQGASRAVLVIHEFVTDETHDVKHAQNAADLAAFWARLASADAPALRDGALSGPIRVPGRPLFAAPCPLYVGKVRRVLRQSDAAIPPGAADRAARYPA